MKVKNSAVLLFGSNIEPLDNIKKAFELIKKTTDIEAHSRIWESEAVGSDGPNFLNMAVEIQTDLSAKELKSKILDNIEYLLGRVRTADRNAPRTIDIDIIIFNGIVLDDEIWTQAFVAQPVSDILPGLMNPNDHSTLLDTAVKLKSSTHLELFAKDLS